jgi:hypothetical protein
MADADPPPVIELQVNTVDPQAEAQWRAVLSGDHQGISRPVAAWLATAEAAAA